MQHFYDGQIRRYLAQTIRVLSNFTVKYGDGTLVRVPVMYGDSDGDFDEQENNKERAYWYYDAYQGEKDPKKKDEYLKIAREYGSYLGWGEEELPVNEGIEDMDPLEREARIALSRIGYNHSVLTNYSRQDFIDTLKKESKDRFNNEELDDLDDGKSIRRKSWIPEYLIGKYSRDIELNLQDLQARDWEVVDVVMEVDKIQQDHVKFQKG